MNIKLLADAQVRGRVDSMKQPITAPLRRALLKAKSRYEVSRETGIDQATLSRFARGLADLRLANADLLARYFELELGAPSERKPGGKAR